MCSVPMGTCEPITFRECSRQNLQKAMVKVPVVNLGPLYVRAGGHRMCTFQASPCPMPVTAPHFRRIQVIGDFCFWSGNHLRKCTRSLLQVFLESCFKISPLWLVPRDSVTRSHSASLPVCCGGARSPRAPRCVQQPELRPVHPREGGRET